ncbi:serine hydrolase [Flagellimonas sp.]|uniref:serine hydrolase n=1 Tax=Flagellimonas sp. TaxID=2058762 RepID=UPI003B508C27
MEKTSIGQNLTYYRKLRGQTQKKLADKTQITVRTIQRIEKGEVNPHLQTIKLLAAALEIEVNDLLPLENPKEETIKKKWLLLLHATPLLGLFFPLTNILVPLFIWIHKREDNVVYDRHGIKVLNFQITISLLAILSFIALFTIEKWGFLIFIALIPICVLIMLTNIVYVVKKHKCHYPFSIPFLKTKKPSKMFCFFLCIIAIAFQSSCTAQKEHAVERLDGTSITKDSLERKVIQLMNDANVTGMALSVFNQNKPAFSKTFGYKDFPRKLPLTDSTNIYGASFSKAVFGVLVMKVVEEGVIDLDTPLESYLPKKIYEYEPQTRWHDDFSDLRQDSLYHKITARMCLAHTTGFPNYRGYGADEKLKVRGIPGSKYGYSGEGFIYLQVVLEKLTGKGLDALAQEKLFNPLGIKNSAYEWKPHFENDFAHGHNANGEKFEKDKDNEPRGGGTLETTAADYTKFLTAVLNERIISKASYKELFSPQIRITAKAQFGEGVHQETDKYDEINLSYGLGWGYFETPYGIGVFKEGNGSGFQHHSLLFPDSGHGIMIMTNSVTGNGIFKELLEIALMDTFTPWEWEGYVPYQSKPNENTEN